MYNFKLPRPLLAACLSHLMTYITELLHVLSVESIVVSFFNNQRKQFKKSVNQQHQQQHKLISPKRGR